ncbi:MAG: argininosuccinate lyase [Candidatus Omnitrophica bacterium]|nr:argininosuccinate lyase [Candidatus Omnitrophota bacterium]
MKKLWGGRFKDDVHPKLKLFSYSLAVDSELFEAEIAVDIAWARMLGRVKLITASESQRLVRGLKAIEKEFSSKGRRVGIPKECFHQYEDVHTLIQAQLDKRVGSAARKLHTGRSRNDLVVASTRIYLREKICRIRCGIREVQKALIGLARKSGKAVVSGMTHLKKAQPVLLAHHLLAYVEMLEEDISRFEDTAKRSDVLPLGSAALAGTSLPVDQKFLAKELGFSRVAANSLSAVSDRAFLVEFLSAVAVLWMHLSRLSEDFILWNSEAFDYIELGDAFATGSSLMPHKKNPDVFELIRGRSGGIFGHLNTLLIVQKGLPLAYNRDLQEDKPALFDAVNKTVLALEVLAPALDSVTVNTESLDRSVDDDSLFATDILEYLVRKGVSLSDAHEAVGKVVRYASDAGKSMRDLQLEEWKRFFKHFDAGIYDLFDPQYSVFSKRTIGSTHPDRVEAEIAKWEKCLRK